MQVRMMLDHMTIDNFKGISHLEISFGETLTRISGANGSGKSTVADAFAWCLLGKDCSGNAPGQDTFRIKPLDLDGNEMHNLTTAVEIAATVDGEPFALKRQMQENWVRKRGNKDAVFQGDNSTFWINGVPLKANEYAARIDDQVCSKAYITYVTILGAFNAAPMATRRSVLLDLVDSNVDAKLLASEEFRPLQEECAGRGVGIADLKKALQGSQRETNQTLKIIPARIDEARRSLTEISDAQLNEAKKSAEDLPARIDQLTAEIARGGSSAGAEAAFAIGKLKQDLADRRAKKLSVWREQITHYKSVSESEGSIVRALHDALDLKAKAHERYCERIGETKAAIAAKRKEYSTLYTSQYEEPENSGICPTCGQKLPAKLVEETLRNDQFRWANDKKARLDQIIAEGKNANATLSQLTKELDDLESETADLMAKCMEHETELKRADKAVADLEAAKDGMLADEEEELAITKQIDELQAVASAPADTHIAELKAERTVLQTQLSEANKVLAMKDVNESTLKRIKDLEYEQISTGEMLMDIERKLALCDQFSRERCSCLEESINALFPTVKWQLFEIQDNGGVKDKCMCMIPCSSGGLIPYGDETGGSANTAARMAADMEICEVLAEQLNRHLPLFLDRAESMNHIPTFGGQLITLTVSGDPGLTVSAE